jgi:hypothetical protein
MNKLLRFTAPALLLVMPFSLAAEEEKKDTYIYATYFYCDTATQEKADELVKKNTAPINDAATADGTITGWGWLSHHTGGKWRRIQYHMSDTVDGLFSAQDTLAERAEKAGVSNDGFAEICNYHDDYIWKMESGNGLNSDRATAALSVYHVCDLNREQRADEIMAKEFAPVYNKAVTDGKIKSWGWSSHVMGGKYRRLGTMTAESYPALMAAWGEILDTIYGDGGNAVANEFSEICSSHSDYLWDIVHEKRK